MVGGKKKQTKPYWSTWCVYKKNKKNKSRTVTHWLTVVQDTCGLTPAIRTLKHCPLPTNKTPHRTRWKQNPSLQRRSKYMSLTKPQTPIRENCSQSERLSSVSCVSLPTQTPMHSISRSYPKIVLPPDPISLLITTFGVHLERGRQIVAKPLIFTPLKSVPETSPSCVPF